MPPFSLRPDEAANALGVSRRTLDTLIADRTPGLSVVRMGRTVLIPVDVLRRWLDAQSNQATHDQQIFPDRSPEHESRRGEPFDIR